MLLQRATHTLVRRAFSTEAAASASAPTATKASSRGSSFGQRLVAFAVGFAVAGGAGLYQLNEDLAASNAEIQKAIGTLKSDVMAQNAALVKRIEQLEKRQQ
ncbi:hypothetical protein PybrP1_000863 [[Pythium] brassicae (nom. inval.)]|nr:hypothetical protein PybrP1_000863 [[Pythium] brassicae (nom. inval.)]